jgi:hypothetical protein
MIPAGHGHEYQGASPAASPGRSLDRDTTTESILASPAPRSEPSSLHIPVPSDPTLTRFQFDGHDTRRRRHPSHLIWANAIEETKRVVMRDAAATVVLAYVLGLRESSVMSLTTRSQNITHTATKEGVREGI